MSQDSRQKFARTSRKSSCKYLDAGWGFGPRITESNVRSTSHVSVCGLQLFLRVRPPGIEWKTGRNPKMGKN